jgi:hypothetical protein
MTTARRILSPRTAARDAGLALRTLLPPVRAPRFWIVQAGVLSVALLHDIVLVDVPGTHHSYGVTDAMTSAFLLIPVIYAALNFGVRGAFATAVWATALITPHWWLMHDMSRTHLVIELGNLAVLYTVAIVVGSGWRASSRHGAAPRTPLRPRGRPGLGLQGMRERATLAGGTLQVSARSPNGTIIHARLPSAHLNADEDPGNARRP